jgi:hypothetical protein
MPVDEFGLTSEDREVQRQRRMVLDMGARLPRIGDTRWQRLRAWVAKWLGR